MSAAPGLVVLAATACLAFASMSAAVVGGIAETVDLPVSTFVRALPTRPWLDEAARDLTSLGSNLVLGLACLIAAGYAASIGRRRMAARMLAAPAGCLLLVGIVKSLAHRPRPPMPPDGPLVFTSSFPSSHAALSAAVFAAIAGSLLDRQPSRGAAMLVVAAAGLSISVGLSRVYLGLHWPSDVAAGWALGLGWACICLGVTGDERRAAQPR